MSKLIDNLINDKQEQIEIGNKWFIAKPLNKPTICQRIVDSIKVLSGKSRAFHYKEDELTKICTRANYDKYSCACEECIKLDIREDNSMITFKK